MFNAIAHHYDMMNFDDRAVIVCKGILCLAAPPDQQILDACDSGSEHIAGAVGRKSVDRPATMLAAGQKVRQRGLSGRSSCWKGTPWIYRLPMAVLTW